MSLGILLLSILTILVLFGFAGGVLDRMRLNDKAVALFLIAMIIGTFLPDIPLGNRLSINIGGAIIPIALVVYLFVKAGTVKEKIRSILASIISAMIVFFISKFFTGDEYSTIFSDPFLIYGLIGGLVSYIIGRSRRAAFMAGIMGIVLSDLLQAIFNIINGIPGEIRIGGAGVIDATVISGIIAVILAEIIGETREKIQGGTDKKDMTFNHSEFASSLGEKLLKKDQKKDKNIIDKGRDQDEK
ncbi:DUF1614 domain-containing protein [Garciella nitratireducens]|uniref:DUF1614 domain-containing protein n=1 Tax=Garciella nitratireducens TaxID=218205 RepID=UPI000DE859C7|nr:DUF1614 domain-containing protein [Garciella nitratireducens]RBP39203.1 uncharacterized protein DUF1614 [Garciella nitratireducens]